MLILIITIFTLILGILLLLIYYQSDGYNELLAGIGATCLAIGGIFFIIEMAFLVLKPLDYKEFKVKYEVVKDQITNKSDIRDATFTQNIIEINTEIMECREYKDSIWIGIFKNEKICDMELLKKDE